MSSIGKNITELCLFYCVASLHKFHVPVCNFLVINRVLQAHKLVQMDYTSIMMSNEI